MSLPRSLFADSLVAGKLLGVMLRTTCLRAFVTVRDAMETGQTLANSSKHGLVSIQRAWSFKYKGCPSSGRLLILPISGLQVHAGQRCVGRDVLDGVWQYCSSDVDEILLDRSDSEGSTDFPDDEGLFQSESRSASI
jgi:hypothetical protein